MFAFCIHNLVKTFSSGGL